MEQKIVNRTVSQIGFILLFLHAATELVAADKWLLAIGMVFAAIAVIIHLFGGGTVRVAKRKALIENMLKEGSGQVEHQFLEELIENDDH